MSKSDINPNVPLSVSVAFPRADSGILGTSYYIIAVTLASLSLPNYSGFLGHNGTRMVHSTAVANFSGGGSPVNVTELTTLAQRVARDFYSWRLASLEVRYASVAPWVSDGMHDVEWTHVAGGIVTSIHRSEWEPGNGRLKQAGTYGSSDTLGAGLTEITSNGTIIITPTGTVRALAAREAYTADGFTSLSGIVSTGTQRFDGDKRFKTLQAGGVTVIPDVDGYVSGGPVGFRARVNNTGLLSSTFSIGIVDSGRGESMLQSTSDENSSIRVAYWPGYGVVNSGTQGSVWDYGLHELSGDVYSSPAVSDFVRIDRPAYSVRDQFNVRRTGFWGQSGDATIFAGGLTILPGSSLPPVISGTGPPPGTGVNNQVYIDITDPVNPVQYVYTLGTPTVTAKTGNIPIGGLLVVIHGTNFSTIAAQNTLAITGGGGVTGTVAYSDSTHLYVVFDTLPTTTADLFVTVTTPGGSSSSTQISTGSAAPTVTTNTASIAQNAVTMTIAGTGFSDPDTVLSGNVQITLMLDDEHGNANVLAYTFYGTGAASVYGGMEITAITGTSMTLTWPAGTGGPLGLYGSFGDNLANMTIGHPIIAANVAMDGVIGSTLSVQVATVAAALTHVWEDTFTDTNGTNLESHTPDTTPGGGYTKQGGATALQIQSNAVEGGAAATSLYYFSPGLTASTGTLRVRFPTQSSPTGMDFSLNPRATGFGNHVTVTINFNGLATWSLQVLDGLGAADFQNPALAFDTWYDLVVVNIAGSVTATINGVSASISVTTYNTQTDWQLSFASTSGAAPPLVIFDDLTIDP